METLTMETQMNKIIKQIGIKFTLYSISLAIAIMLWILLPTIAFVVLALIVFILPCFFSTADVNVKIKDNKMEEK